MKRALSVPRWGAVALGVVAIGVIALGGLALASWAGGSATPAVASGAPHFVEETATSGLSHTYGGDVDRYSVGGGVAVFDCNGDGKPEIYVAGGSNPAELFRNDSLVGGALRFTVLHSLATDLTGVVGAYPVDIDGDGKTDLAVLRAGETVLLRGLGGCRFERANEAWGFDGGSALTTAFSATWEGSNALPTLALGRYLKLDSTGQANYECDSNAVLRPVASGHAYGPPLSLSPGYCTLSMLFSSWDRSGRRDLRITNDRHYYGTDGEDQLWRIAPGEQPRQYTATDGWIPLQIWGMGIASYDVTGDGYPDVYITSQGDNKLQTLTAGPSAPSYRDIALRRDVTFTRAFTGSDATLPSTAWHPEFQDVNNDGFIDLFVSKGNVSVDPDYAQKDPSDLGLGQPDGTFKEAADAAGIINFDRGRGAAVADFNLDGLLDVVEVNYGAPVRVWRNAGAGDATHPASLGNWLSLQVQEPAPNVDAIGAWVEVKVGDTTTRRELTIGGGHCGGEIGWLHFGLGPSKSAQVRVQWPDGETGPWMQVDGNQFVVIDRGAAQPQPWRPAATSGG